MSKLDWRKAKVVRELDFSSHKNEQRATTKQLEYLTKLLGRTLFEAELYLTINQASKRIDSLKRYKLIKNIVRNMK